MRARILLSALFALLCAPAAMMTGAELVPGLVGEYFAVKEASTYPAIPASQKPIFVRVDPWIVFDEVGEGAHFHGTRLSGAFYARWTGVIRINTAGKYQFGTMSDDASRIIIDGKPVVDHDGIHAMTQKTGEVELTAGDHQILVEYCQAGGSAGIVLRWAMAGDELRHLSKDVLFHDKAAEAVEWNQQAWLKLSAEDPGVMSSDYGPYITHTIEASFPAPRNYAYKGVVVKLAEAGKANLCFDTESLRVSCAWDGSYLKVPTNRDGVDGGHPVVVGRPVFGTKPGPGWAKGGSFADPRAKGQGPLPADWAKWKGLHLDGNQVVLSYRVGTTEVLEAPSYAAQGAAFVRSFTVGATTEPLAMLVCEEAGAAVSVTGATARVGSAQAATSITLAGAADGVALAEAKDGRLHLTIAPSPTPRSFALTLVRNRKEAALTAPAISAVKPVDLAALPSLTKGGAPRWGKPIATAFTQGSGDGPYVVDTVVVPFENPWKSAMRLTGFDFFADGRIAVCTIEGDVWIVSGLGDGQTPQWQRFATGLFQGLGLKIVDGKVCVIGRDQLTVLHDRNGDGEADFYQNLNNDCVVTDNYHEFALDLQTDKAGNFYYGKGSPWPPDVTSPHQGTMMKISKDGAKMEIFATGLRAPNGLGMGPNDELTFSDNQGHWTPACKINLVKPGGFYGMVPAAHRDTKPTTFDRPLCYLPMNVDNSSGGQGWVAGDKWGPFAGQLLHSSYGMCTFFVMMHETINGVTHGAAVKLPLQTVKGHAFQSGIMRIRQSPTDGQIWVCGMRGWQTNAKQTGALQRVRWTGKPANLPKRFHVTKTGVEITFTDPLDPATAGAAENYALEQWNYQWTQNYGSPETKPSDGKNGHDKIDLTSVNLSADHRTVTLTFADLKPVDQLKIKYRLKGADGRTADNEIYATINAVP